MKDNFVLREDAGRVCTLTLNRPEVLNALNVPLFAELRAHVDRLGRQAHEVACVVLKGAGKAFSAGHDLKDIQKGEHAPESHFQANTIRMLAGLPQPVIACVRGHCYTGGLELALGADIIVASRSAKFGDTHGKWGLSPLWGMSQRLPRRVGPSTAKLMMFTADIYSAEAAERMGLVDICVDDTDLDQATLALANRIAANSTHSNQVNKELLAATDGMSMDQGLAHELKHSPGACADARERLAAFGRK